MRATGNALIAVGIGLLVAGFVFVTIREIIYPQPSTDPYGLDINTTLSIIKINYPGIAMILGGIVLGIVGGVMGGHFK